jgi:hypothetical protein
MLPDEGYMGNVGLTVWRADHGVKWEIPDLLHVGPDMADSLRKKMGGKIEDVDLLPNLLDGCPSHFTSFFLLYLFCAKGGQDAPLWFEL